MSEPKATVGIFLDTRTKKANDVYPVKIRVTFLRKPRNYGTGIDLTSTEWEKINGERLRDNSLKDVKIQLEGYQNKARKIIDSIKPFSFEVFAERYYGKVEGKRTITDDVYLAFRNRIEELTKEKRTGTAISYSDSMKSLQRFKKRLTFHAVTVDFLKKYERWMVDENGNSKTTTGMYIRALRAIYNDAIKAGIIPADSYPFGQDKHGLYSIPKGKNIKKALTLPEIEKIFHFDCSGNMQYCRDIWMFSYFSNGMNLADIAKLKYKDVGEKTIHFVRSKTVRSNPVTIVAPLNDYTRDIITRWGNKDKNPDTYVFPILEPGMEPQREKANVKNMVKLLGKYMRRIGAELDIDKPLSSYAARHSFASVLKRSGVSTEIVSEMLGHNSLETTKNYLASFEDEALYRVAGVLMNFDSKKDEK